MEFVIKIPLLNDILDSCIDTVKRIFPQGLSKEMDESILSKLANKKNQKQITTTYNNTNINNSNNPNGDINENNNESNKSSYVDKDGVTILDDNDDDDDDFISSDDDEDDDNLNSINRSIKNIHRFEQASTF